MITQWPNCSILTTFAALAVSQAEADESLTRMLEWLDAPGVVARVEPSTDALLVFELVESRTCWRPSPKKFWRITLALRKLAFGKGRRTGAQISCALGHAMSVFGLRRELDSFFQYAYPIVAHFEGRVGRVWASMRRELCIAGRCSHLQRVISRDRGMQLFMPQTRLFLGVRVAALAEPSTLVKCVGSVSERWRLKGPMRATSKKRSALDEEIGPLIDMQGSVGTLPVDQHLVLDNLLWLRRCWGGLRQAEFWACGVERRR